LRIEKRCAGKQQLWDKQKQEEADEGKEVIVYYKLEGTDKDKEKYQKAQNTKQADFHSIRWFLPYTSV
jgi:hypothetical protein